MSKQIPFLFDIPSVSELTEKIKTLLESNFIDILVEGEASNVKKSANGHIYFTLKDSNAQIPCDMLISANASKEMTTSQQKFMG